MAYKGMPIFKQEELTSLKRMRESAGVLPDGSGFFTATVQTPKTKEAGKKGMKWGVRQDKELSNAGFKQTKGNSRVRKYEHSDKSKGSYNVGSDNSWTHSDADGRATHGGWGAGSLHDHLAGRTGSYNA